MTFDPSNPDHERFAASPILASMQKIVPGYWPDDSQGYAMLGSRDPEKDAGYIAKRLELVRDAVAHEFGHMGLTRDSITDAQALRALRHFEGLPGTHGNEANLVKWLGPETLVQIGIDHAKPKGLVELCYEELLGRPSDGPGFKHYQDRLDAGEPRYQIIRDIELSPEALG